jgi:hypothetical protein
MRIGIGALVALVVALGCDRPRQVESSGAPIGSLAQRVRASGDFNWREVALPDLGLRVYLQRETESTGVVDSVRRAQEDVLAMLEEPKSAPREAAVFVLASRADMQRLAGRPLAGFVQPGEPTAFFVWSPGYRPPLRHELAHLATFERWGPPAAGDSATWLVEGIGGWAGGACLGNSPDALASGVLARGAVPTLAAMTGHFRSLPEDVGMPTASSFVQYLYARGGVAALRSLWQGAGTRGLPDTQMDGAWRAHLTTVPPATLDIARVMKEGC